ncbi:MAG: MarR family transcriptional regulator [Desulfobacter sp.]|nr:MAG: MarR family transcriptional regulator [Desulfobacter sp.]
MKNDILKIHGKFQSLMELALKLDRAPKKFGTDQDLSHSEIHLIEIIGDNRGMGVTDMARCLGVTKGAVSQNLKRLETKGLAVKSPDPENLARVVVTLTAKGKTAYWAHRHWHETMDGGFSEYLHALDGNDVKVILDFLGRVEDFLVRRTGAAG